MRIRILLISFLVLLNTHFSFGQESVVFTRLQTKLLEAKTTPVLYGKLDSIKQIWKNGVQWSVYFKRSVDFEFEHQRLELKFGNFNFLINLLTRGDEIYINSFTFNTFGDDAFNPSALDKKLIRTIIDTPSTLSFLKQRNQFYKSAKTVGDLTADLMLDKTYAFYCGDGMTKTDDGKQIEKLVGNKDINKLIAMMQSVNCEEQAFGKAGFDMLKKVGFTKFPDIAYQLSKRITAIKPSLKVCSGCLIYVEPLK